MPVRAQTTPPPLDPPDERFGPALPAAPTIIDYRPKGMGDATFKLLRCVAGAHGTPPRFVLFSTLAAIAGLVGSRCSVEFRLGHREPLSMLVLLTGPSGCGKSQGMRASMEALARIEADENENEGDPSDPAVHAVLKAREKRVREAAVEAYENGTTRTETPPDIKRFYEGLHRYTLLTTDGSAAGIAQAARESRHGIVIAAGEATKILTGGQARDIRDLLLTGFDGGISTKTTISGGRSEGRVAISAVLATVTERLPQLKLDEGDGLTGRLIVVVAGPRPAQRASADASADPNEMKQALQDYDTVLRIVRTMDLPEAITLTPEAAEHLAQVADELRSETIGAGPGMIAAVARAHAMMGRLAATVEVLYRAVTIVRSGRHARSADRLHADESQSECSQLEVSTACARVASDVFRNLLLPGMRSVLEGTAPGLPTPAVQRFAEAMIERHGTERVSLRELSRRPGIYGLAKAEVRQVKIDLLALGVAREENIGDATTGRPSAGITLEPAYIEAWKARKRAIEKMEAS